MPKIWIIFLTLLFGAAGSKISLPSGDCPLNASLMTSEKRYEYWESETGGEAAIFRRSLKHVYADMEPDEFYKTLNGRRVKRFFEELNEGKRTMQVYVFGGSLTAGRFVGGIYGAWPTVLRDTFNNAMRRKTKKEDEDKGKVDPRIRVHNLATAATTSEWLLHRLPSYFRGHRGSRLNQTSSFLGDNQAADMIILDYNANDCSMHSVGVGAKMDAGRHRVLAIEEALVRRLMQLHSAAIVLYDVAITHRIPYHMAPRCEDEYHSCYAMYEILQPVSHRYAIPVVSQKEGLWEHFHMPPPPEYWDCTKSCAHPKHKAHKMLADIQQNYFLHMTDTLRNSSTTKQGDEDVELVSELVASKFITSEGQEIDEQVCSTFETSVDHISSLHMLQDPQGRGGSESGSGDAEAILVHNSDWHCWTYGEDVPGKFGWLINATDENSPCLAASLVFRVKFGAHEQAIAMSLQTYDKRAGLIEVAVSRPIVDATTAARVPYIYNESDFVFQGALDNYYANRVGDDLHGHSTIVPVRVDNEPGETDAIKAGKVQYVRLRLVNPNIDAWRIYRPDYERNTDRVWPIRAKLASLMTC